MDSVDAFDRMIASGQVAGFRRHGNLVWFGFTPGVVVELTTEDCTALGLALIAVGENMRRVNLGPIVTVPTLKDDALAEGLDASRLNHDLSFGDES